jgi:hypothetical protein
VTLARYVEKMGRAMETVSMASGRRVLVCLTGETASRRAVFRLGGDHRIGDYPRAHHDLDETRWRPHKLISDRFYYNVEGRKR